MTTAQCDGLVARSECDHCQGTGHEFAGIDDTGQAVSMDYCDYCGELARCLDCGWQDKEGERLVATLDQIQGTASGADYLCPKCGGNSTEIVSE
jgi:hypothetical protein